MFAIGGHYSLVLPFRRGGARSGLFAVSGYSKTNKMLKIELDYYDANHKLLLSKAPYRALGTAKRVTEFKKNGQISKEDFLNYFLIGRSDNIDFSTYRSRLSHIAMAAQWLNSVLDTRTTINWRPGNKGLQWQVGEAVSLSVASSMFGLIAADWAIIPEQRGRGAHQTFDFERAMVGITANNEVIQIEAKGSFVDDNTVVQANVAAHAKKIEGKKISIKSKGKAYIHPATARYGLITSMDPKNTAKCWLLDPPTIQFEENPHDLKIANRLAYTAEILSLIAPKALLPVALMNRAKEWREKKTSSPLPSLGHPFTVNNYVEQFLSRGKVWLKDRDVVGQMYAHKKGGVFFIGLHGDVIRSAITQNTDEIASTFYKSYVEEAVVDGSPVFIDDLTKHDSISQPLYLHSTTSGVVIGIDER